MNKLLLIAGFIFLAMPFTADARENVDYWYIKDFESEIQVNTDSSLDIVEKITADTGSAYQHGIFRVLPLTQNTKEKKINSPIELKSITDFNSNPLPFTTIKSYFNKTLTWKIGKEDKLVTGVNEYQITYHVKNAIRHNQDFDELYWNLNGNFWDIPIDRFHAKITFPATINKANLEINTYSGAFGEKNSLNTSNQFTEDNVLSISYDSTLEKKEGITLSASFPKGLIAEYQPTFFEKYGNYLFYLIPLLILFLCYKLWIRYGRDPKINPAIAPEFEIPENLSPIDMGLVYSDGALRNQFISASIINLAIGGHLKIKQIREKGLLKSADYELSKTNSAKAFHSEAEKVLFEKLFEHGDVVKLSSLKNKFFQNLSLIGDTAINSLAKDDLLVPYSRTAFYIFLILGLIALVGSAVLIAVGINLAVSIMLSGIILLVFAPLMTKRSKKGHELYRRILGFKLYMTKAEKFRQQYLEDQNLFEKLLPYAIMFSITSKWISAMKSIYSEKYFSSYHPVWFYGYGLTNFNSAQFSSYINQISSEMSSTIASAPSNSGSGGGGFSGGGGGGGGGGGW